MHSDYHPETWSPLWTVSAILNGLLSFMLSDEKTLECLDTNDKTKEDFAKQSWAFNLKDNTFCKLFPDLAEEAKNKIKG